MTVHDITRFSKLYDLVRNRVGIANQIFGCRYHFASDNPMVITKSHGTYSVSYLDSEVASFAVNDLEGVSSAFEVLDHWSRCLWLLSRSGRLRRESCHT